jgi:hypothetical protein
VNLDLEGKLLGVPKQLAGTHLPAWLSDQLEKKEDDEALDVDEGVELPEPSRATIIRPFEPAEEKPEPEVEESVLDPSFEKWLAELGTEPAAPEWMKDEDQELEDALVRESQHVQVEQPKWMGEIEDERLDSAELLGLNETVEESGRLAGLSGAIQIEPLIAAPLASAVRTDATLSKEQRQHIAVLVGLVRDEQTIAKHETARTPRGLTQKMRVLIAGSLLLLILIGIIVPSSTESLSVSAIPPASVEAQKLYDQIRQAAGAPVMVAFDYTPATAGELNPIAIILLEQIAESGSMVYTVSQGAAGSQMAEIVSSNIEGLEWQQIGYIPGEAVGLRSLSNCLSDGGQCETLFGDDLTIEAQSSLADLSLILLLTSDRESIVAWIEQVAPHLENVEMVAGVTQALGPVIVPYLASGQLAGALNGFPSALAYERDLLGVESQNADQMTGFTLALWLSVGSLIAGTIYYAINGLGPIRKK